MPKRYLVIGLGRFGSAVAEALAQHGAEVVAVDNDMANVEAVKDRVTFAIELDATDPMALRSIEATNCNGAIVAIGENFEANVLTVAALKEVGVQNIIGRARSPRHARILAAVGANRVIELEAEMGRAVGRNLAQDADIAGRAVETVMGAVPPPGGPPVGAR